MTELFVDPGVKLNCQLYRDVLLSQQMRPAIKHVAGDTFVFHKTALRHIAPATPYSCYAAGEQIPEFVGMEPRVTF